MPHLLASRLQPRSDLFWPYLRGEHGGTGPNAPADHRLGEAALLDATADLILLSASDLPGNREQEKAYKLGAPTLGCSESSLASSRRIYAPSKNQAVKCSELELG